MLVHECHPVSVSVCLTVTEGDEEATDKTEKDLPDDSFTVPSNITG